MPVKRGMDRRDLSRAPWTKITTRRAKPCGGERCLIRVIIGARNERDVEVREVLEPVVKRRREKQSRNHGDNDAQLALATALYVQALVDPTHRSSSNRAT